MLPRSQGSLRCFYLSWTAPGGYRRYQVKSRFEGRCLIPVRRLQYVIMIWYGRLLSIPTGVVFFVLLLLTLVLLRVSNTLLDPGYYTEELDKANIYEFALNDALASAIDEYRQRPAPEGLDQNPLTTSGLSTEDIVSSVNRALPPEWVQELVDQSFDQVGRYLTGERDEFEVTVKAGDRAEQLVEEVKGLMRKADAYNLLFEQVVAPRVRDAVDLELPLGVDLPPDRLVEAVRTIVPPTWVQGQVEGALDEVTPYFLGRSNTFEIRVQLGDRVETAVEEVKALLREADAYNLLYDQVIEPEVVKTLGQSVELPFGAAITNQEVLSALRQVAPPEWVQQQAEMVIDQAGPYLTGKEDTFAIEVSLADNKREAAAVIADLADKKLTEVLDSVPQCRTAAEAASALIRGSVPGCLPGGISLSQLRSRLGIDISGPVRRLVLAPIPDSIAFTDTQLRAALVQAGAGGNLDQVDQVRDILGGGWTYTQDDLREELAERGDHNVETLDDVRAFLADGWTYTDADFREDITERAGASVLENLDSGRDALKLSRTYRWVVYLPMIALLVVIGFLGGRGWSGRVAWASGFLVISAGLIYVAFGPVYQSLASSGLEEARATAIREMGPTEFEATSHMATNKAFEMVESVADGFASGVSDSSRGLMVIGLIALGVAFFWGQLMGLYRRYVPDKERELKDWES